MPRINLDELYMPKIYLYAWYMLRIYTYISIHISFIYIAIHINKGVVYGYNIPIIFYQDIFCKVFETFDDT